MLKSYLRAAWQNLRRHQTFAVINIAGLAIGIAAFLLILMVVRFESSFDDFHPDKERIFRLVTVPYKEGTGFDAEPGVPLPVGEGLRLDYPQLEQVASIFGRDAQITVEGSQGVAEKKFNETGGLYYAEPSFFDIFHFPWLEGDPKTALSGINSVALTRSTAEKYFGDWHDAVGRTIKCDNKFVYQVTGILDDPPSNTDFPLSIVVSYKSLPDVNMKDWQGTYGRGYCFAKLPAGLSAERFNGMLREFVKRHKPADQVNNGIMLQPLADIHFNPRFGNFNGRIFSRPLLTTLTLVAFFLLFIACINFINLNTAQSVVRSKEVGVRKVLGSRQSQLVLQFLFETGLVAFLSLALAIVIATAALPYLDGLLQIHLRPDFANPVVVGSLLATGIFVTLVSGLYPAVVCSRFNAVKALHSKLTSMAGEGIFLRRGLVIVQFCIAQVLIISVLVIVSQMNYFRSAPLGFNQKSVVTVSIPTDSVSLSRIPSVRNQLIAQPGIQEVSFSTFSPLDNGIWNNFFTFDHRPAKEHFFTYFKWADANYFKTYGLTFIAGKPYEESDTLTGFVVNETLVKKLGIRDPNEILGKDIYFWADKHGPVKGVVRDFHTNSLQTAIVPVVMGSWNNAYEMIGIRLAPGDPRPALSSIENTWNSAFPDYVYEYQFLDNTINNYYQEEDRLSQLYKIFAAIAIFISCLGLYGLVSFMANQRIKEMGIRKVLGASTTQILVLFSREFTMLIAVAFIIAAPLAYFLINRWLDNFAYRVHPGAGLFLLTISSSLAIAWITVGYKALQAARTNPVHSLRNE